MNITNQSPNLSNPTSINHLPDELILQIINKITNLKSLFFCHFISKRFSQITLQIHNISLTVAPLSDNLNNKNPSNSFLKSLINSFVSKLLPRTKPLPPIISSFYDKSFRSTVFFLTKFRQLKTLNIKLPSSCHKDVDNSTLFKWKVVFRSRVDSFIFISPNSCTDREHNVIEFNETFKKKVHIAFQCLKDVIVRHRMLLYFVKEFPLLESVVICDSGKCGRLSLNGGRVREVRELIRSSVDDVNCVEVPVSVSYCHVDVLDLGRSGFVMKDVTFVVMEMSEGGGGGFVDGDDAFENEEVEEVAYSEAVNEILEKYGDKMKRLL